MIVNALEVSRVVELGRGTEKGEQHGRDKAQLSLPSFSRPPSASKREGQRRVGKINVAVRARGANKCSVEEVAIARVNADMTLELPVDLHIKFSANRTG